MRKFQKYIPLVLTTFIFVLMLYGPLYLVGKYYNKETASLNPVYTETSPILTPTKNPDPVPVSTKSPSPTNNYVCPPSGWVNCMPGPDGEGMRYECTGEFQVWAKANCPDYQGAAY